MLQFSLRFQVPSSCIFEAFTDQFKLMQFTRAPAQVRPEVGADFLWLDGKIKGKFLQLEKNKKIKMQWWMNDWKHGSTVQIQLKDWEDSCEVRVKQSNLPEKSEPKQMQASWMSQIFKPMSMILGYAIQE